MEWYLKVINSYFDFNGRSRRMEYWMFVLINSIISVFCILLDSMLGSVWSIGYGPIYIGYGLAVFVPGLAVAIRRLHDGKKEIKILSTETQRIVDCIEY